jgi:N-acyl-D-amino-acid deacylase
MKPLIIASIAQCIFCLSSANAQRPETTASASVETFDMVITGGRIVDGTGAPWYVGDVGIKEGKISRIGRLGEAKADKRIAAQGLVVAPGFVDMMGQTASPMLEDPKTAINLLTQGITTINAGEGASAAPLDAEAARSEGWATMAEYFQILELRGLPVNVAQTVGHTQVRRLVMGEVDRKPSEEELTKMKGLVREAMEAGAIGLSTALIYPPAVYADTDEIGGLAAVAGEYGGRYYTHMRNEGDQLLEAIDEALEIGRKGSTPVHIFHLKAAGRGNWPKMEQAIAKIKAARDSGMEVTADIYPYINNGLGIEALVHPRHFAEGRGAFIAKIDDAELRETIRAEMESLEGDWENWYKHMGSDWDKLVVGRAHGLRFRKHSGQSLGAIAKMLEIDPWDLFFELVKTGAFVLPETMSDENKKRLIREEFVSFCTDVGPAGGAASASHPRAFGSFPRLLSRYVRDGNTVSLERAIAQASAVASNEILARDRGRIAEGLAADIIVFDYQKLIDRADFANPHAESEGMRYVIVNGAVVLEEGKQTESRPGRVLRGPGYRRDRAASGVSTGKLVPELAAVDKVVQSFLEKHHAPSASVAITDGGRLVYARAFGYADIAARDQARPESRYRIASISKPVTAAAVFHMVEAGKISLDDKIFAILDGYNPPKEDSKADGRLAGITVRNCLHHSGGWDRNKSFDPMFRPVDFAKSLGVNPPAGQDEIIRNMLAQPLDFDPGARQTYSNFGYCLLGRAIAKISGMEYDAYVKQHVLDPVGARTMALGRSMLALRQENEVRYYSPFRGPSVFSDSLGKRVPYPYGGWHLEAMDSHGAWIASAIDLARFAVAFDGDGTLLKKETLTTMFARPEGKTALDEDGKPKDRCYAAGWARLETDSGPVFSHGGSLAGTSTYFVKRPDGRNWVILFNTRGSPHSSFLPNSIEPDLNRVLDSVNDWPTHDLFASFDNNQRSPVEKN